MVPAVVALAKRNLLSVLDLKADLDAVLGVARRLKSGKVVARAELGGKTLAMIFEKPSTRTRVSFEVAMTELGGRALYLSSTDLQIGRGETIADTARVLSRYVDAILYRAFSHKTMAELAEHASVPVINGLDDLEHPCQIVGDLLTIRERKGKLAGLRLAYVGDGNNVCNSLLLGCALSGVTISVGCPKRYMPDAKILETAKALAAERSAGVEVHTNPFIAVKRADVVYTDVWVSMGQEGEKAEKERVFLPYQVTRKLVAEAKPEFLFMHCLPAHRGAEVAAEVIDGPNSVVFDQAENRLHAQKAILLTLLK